ncbi:MAG: DUF2240 family protein [Archaeoglobaceae archaeon]|nr:DUF2240 family protein [Archaeoglobaceae archaeon]MCX8152384.1 DUF2240 family protein [Archaeoglobaceae archaeon]MDW8013724.1 DUF2240 family protein [Archaeoglobaceae archaeon]
MIAEEIIERIASKTGKSIQEVVSEINKKQEKLGNILSFEVVALIYAKECGVKISDLMEKVEKKLYEVL